MRVSSSLAGSVKLKRCYKRLILVGYILNYIYKYNKYIIYCIKYILYRISLYYIVLYYTYNVYYIKLCIQYKYCTLSTSSSISACASFPKINPISHTHVLLVNAHTPQSSFIKRTQLHQVRFT